MGILRRFRSAAFTGGVAALFLLFGCGGGGGGSTAGGGATGSVNLAVTDAPSDNWEQVSVVVHSASLIAAGSQTPVPVWTADPASPDAGVVNLVDLNSVATLLGTVKVAPGTYDTLQLTLDTDPATMTLVDDNGNTIPAADITVKGSGTLNVPLAPPLVVTAGGTATLQADFDLANPLSIAAETVNGVEKVVLDLQVRFKPLPPDPRKLEFARKLGQVTAVAASGFTLTDRSGSAFNYSVDANTIYVDADTKAAGSQNGLTVGKYALVASNLEADGSLYARRVWYAASAATLPAWTPEGLVRSVTPASDSFTIFTKAVAPATARTIWTLQTVKVDASTVWTFHTGTAMGTGTAFLQDIWRGFRVDVQLDSTGATATAVNIQAARDEGFVGSVTATGITLGLPGLPPPPIPLVVSGPPAPAPPNGPANLAARTYAYDENSANPSEVFSWWYFGLPSSADPSAADLLTVFTASQTTQLPVMGAAELSWDTGAGAWQVSRLVLEPEPLSTAVITTAYTDGGSGSGTMGVTCLNPFNDFDATTPTQLTITLDYTGDLQTVVADDTWNGLTLNFTPLFPVPPSQWPTLLVPPASPGATVARIWVRPVIAGATIAWHAYSVSVFNGLILPDGPVITSFTANPAAIQPGDSAALTGVFANGAGVITPGNLSAASGVPVTVTPAATTTYTLTVTGPDGRTVTRTTTVTVGSTSTGPVITEFKAQPPTIPLGATASLVAVFANGTGVITPGNLPILSQVPLPVAPTTTTTYTLTVTNAAVATPAVQTTTLTVLLTPPPQPVITSFTAAPATIPAGGSATLTPVFSGGSAVINPGNLPATTSGAPVTVFPGATTTYTLTVTNAAGTLTTQTAVVTVTPAS